MSRPLLIALLVVVMAPVDLAAQDCADWTTTMAPHATLIEDHDAKRIHVVGDLWLTAHSRLHVFDASDPDEPVLVGEVDTPGLARGFRDLGGDTYLIAGMGGLLSLDLGDPDQPSFTVVHDPELDLFDAARTESGATAVLSLNGSLHILDAADQHVATLDVGLAACVAAKGDHFLVGVYSGVLPIDAGDPANPIVGEVADCVLEGASTRNQGIYDIVGVGEIAYIIAGAPPSACHCRLVEVDVSDPAVPTALAERCTERVTRLMLWNDLLISVGNDELAFHEKAGFHPLGRLHPSSFGISDACLTGDDLLAMTSAGSIVRWRIDAGRTVLPVSTFGTTGRVSGYGRYRLSSRVTENEYGGDSLDYTVYDCVDPAAPNSVLSGSLTSGHEWQSLSASLITQDDTKVGIVCWSSGEPWLRFRDFGPSHRDLVLAGVAWCAFADDVLWTIELISGDDRVVARDLNSPGLEELGSVAIGRGYPIHFDPPWFLIGDHPEISVIDVSDPASPAIAAVHEAEHYLRRTPVEKDGTLIFTFGSRLVAYDFSRAPELEHVCTFDLGFAQNSNPSFALAGDLLVASAGDEWRTVSVSDPANPTLLSPIQSLHCPQFLISGHHLYAGEEDGMVHLFDLSDPVTPHWLGQATADNDAPFMRDGRLYFGHAVLLPDCGDPAPIDGAEPEEGGEPSLPAAAALHQPTPNPFNPVTTLSFDLTRSEHTTITIHDLRGRHLTTLADAPFPAGHHTLTWHGTDTQGRALPSGTYLVRFTTESAVRTAKAVLIR